MNQTKNQETTETNLLVAKFLTTDTSEEGHIQIIAPPNFIELLNKVVVKKGEPDGVMFSFLDQDYKRYRVKKDIKAEFESFLFLFEKNLIETGTTQFEGTNRNYRNLIRILRNNDFRRFIQYLYDYGEHTFSLKIQGQTD